MVNVLIFFFFENSKIQNILLSLILNVSVFSYMMEHARYAWNKFFNEKAWCVFSYMYYEILVFSSMNRLKLLIATFYWLLLGIVIVMFYLSGVKYYKRENFLS